jgi:hypothetical protein
MRTIRASIAATALVISVVTAAHAAPLDCTSRPLYMSACTWRSEGLLKSLREPDSGRIVKDF